MRGGTGRVGILVWVAVMATLAVSPVHAEQAFREYKVKAAFLFNFTMLVRWPDDAFEDDSSPITIGLLGEGRIGGFLSDSIKDKAVGGRKVRIRQLDQFDAEEHGRSLRECHIVFVSSSERRNTGAITQLLRGQPVLTVGETEAFAESGGMIEFYLDAERVRFRVNNASARESGLKISSRLLGLAEVVR